MHISRPVEIVTQCCLAGLQGRLPWLINKQTHRGQKYLKTHALLLSWASLQGKAGKPAWMKGGFQLE